MARIATDNRGKSVISGPSPFDTVRRDAKRESFAFANTKTSIDLSCFKTFDRQLGGAKVKAKYTIISAGKHGIHVGRSLGLEVGKNYKIYLNNKATILVLQEAEDGHKLSVRRRMYCQAMQDELAGMDGVKLPLRFEAAWDPELGAWVGRR